MTTAEKSSHTPAKPHLRPTSIPWLEHVVTFAVEHDCFRRPSELPAIISDALDGYAFRHEIADIVHAGIAVEIPLGPGEYTLAGVTWQLTEYGTDLLRSWSEARP